MVDLERGRRNFISGPDWEDPHRLRPFRPLRHPAAADAEAWEVVKNSTDPALIEQFLREYAGSAYAGAARLKLATSIESAEIRTRVESNKFFGRALRVGASCLLQMGAHAANSAGVYRDSEHCEPIACHLFLACVIAVLVLKAAWFSGTAITLLLIPIAIFGIWFLLFRR
jgi:hypothetical protein